MSDCNECGGTGKVPNYREPARKATEEPKPKKEWKMNRRKVGQWACRVVYVGAIVSFIGLCGYSIRTCNRQVDKENAERDEYEKRMGYIVVQYDVNANVARCWITGWYRTCHDGEYSYEPNYPVKTDHLGSIEVYDRHNVDVAAAKKIGVNDPSTCIR